MQADNIAEQEKTAFPHVYESKMAKSRHLSITLPVIQDEISHKSHT